MEKVVTINLVVLNTSEYKNENDMYFVKEYPEMDKYFNEGYIIKQAIPFQCEYRLSITFILSKDEKQRVD